MEKIDVNSLDVAIENFLTKVFENHGGDLIENPQLLSAITDLTSLIVRKQGI